MRNQGCTGFLRRVWPPVLGVKSQRGDFLIEAMIGALLTVLISLGIIAISSRVMSTQEEMGLQETLVATLREKMYGHNLTSSSNQCTASAALRTLTLPNRGQVTYTVNHCTPRVINYTFNGQTYTVNLPLIDIEVTVPLKPNVNVRYALGAG